MGLASLPAPKNDYEIVVPEDESGHGEDSMDVGHVEDQADLDSKREAEIERRRQEELKRRSQSVQRDLPRPVEINSAVMRPTGPNDPPLTDLQKVRWDFVTGFDELGLPLHTGMHTDRHTHAHAHTHSHAHTHTHTLSLSHTHTHIC